MLKVYAGSVTAEQILVQEKCIEILYLN